MSNQLEKVKELIALREQARLGGGEKAIAKQQPWHRLRKLASESGFSCSVSSYYKSLRFMILMLQSYPFPFFWQVGSYY